MWKVLLLSANLVVLVVQCMDYRVARVLTFTMFCALLACLTAVSVNEHVVIGQVVGADPVSIDDNQYRVTVNSFLPALDLESDTPLLSDSTRNVFLEDALGDFAYALKGKLWIVGYGAPIVLSDQSLLYLHHYEVQSLPTIDFVLNPVRIEAGLRANGLIVFLAGIAVLFSGSALFRIISSVLFGVFCSVSFWHVATLLNLLELLPVRSTALYVASFAIGLAFGCMCFRVRSGVVDFVMQRMAGIVVLFLALSLLELFNSDYFGLSFELWTLLTLFYPPSAIALLSSSLATSSFALFETHAVSILTASFVCTFALSLLAPQKDSEPSIIDGEQSAVG